MREMAEAWRLIAAAPVESACALVSLLAFLGGVLWGLPVLAAAMGWA